MGWPTKFVEGLIKVALALLVGSPASTSVVVGVVHVAVAVLQTAAPLMEVPYGT